MATPAPLPVPIITAVELAVVDRLTRGLGKLVTFVETYGGEFDDENLADVIRRFPAAWVTFGGVKKTTPVDMGRQKWKAEGTFVVMVGARSVRSEAASRHGGPAQGEVGTNLLIYAVRRLLAQQDMGLPIKEFAPGSVRTLFNTRLQREAFSVFALEFHTEWVESVLPRSTFPQPAAATDMDAVFAAYGGQLDPAAPYWDATQLNYFLDPTREAGTPSAQDILKMQPPAGASNEG
jgi:phage gp37-like protein